MFAESPSIDEPLRASYLTTTANQHVNQLVGLLGPENYQSSMNARPPGAYEDNSTDYIWELQEGGADQIGEVIEHLLHTVSAVGFRLAFPQDWDYTNHASALYLAMQEAVDKGYYDISSYSGLQGDPEGYSKTLTTEYIYWLILAEWDYFVVAGKKRDGMSGNDEFTLGTPAEIAENLPLGHQLYQDHVVKILSIPEPSLVTTLFP